MSEELVQMQFRGNTSLGVFALANERIAVVPLGIEEALQSKIEAVLQVPVVETSISGISLVGTMAAAGPESLIIPPYTRDKEIQPILDAVPDLHIVTIPTKLTALGNLVTLSRRTALVSSELEPEAKQTLADELSVEVIDATVASSPLVGAGLFNTPRGCLVHPLIKQSEMEVVQSALNGNADLTTVNRGVPYPRTGLIGNSRGIVAGADTTGPELMRIYEVLLS